MKQSRIPAPRALILANYPLFGLENGHSVFILQLVATQSPVRRGSLYRRLVIPLSAFVLLASLALAIWISSLQRRESLRRFQQTAISNAGFMGQVPLPRSREMAQRLSTILEARVAFLRMDGTIVRSSNHGWPDDLENVLKEIPAGKTTASQVGDHELALSPLPGTPDHLILVRDKEGGLAGLGGWVLAPTLFLTAAFGCLVLLLAHRIVHPLTVLTRWLPNLKHDEEPAELIFQAVSLSPFQNLLMSSLK